VVSIPTITVSINDLSSLAGADLPPGKLTEVLSDLKCEVESLEGDEITYEVTSDRPDLFSSEGAARAIAHYLGRPVREARHSALPPLELRVTPSVAGVRPFIVAAALRGVTMSAEAIVQIMQLQEKLHNTYGSNRKKASIGIYDLDTVAPGFVYDALPPGEIRFIPLESDREMSGREILESTPKGRDYAGIIQHFERYPLLTDSNGRVLSMPPIINSEDTKVTGESHNILVDVTGTEEKAVEVCLNVVASALSVRGGALQRVEVSYPDRVVETPSAERQRQRLSQGAVRAVSSLDLTTGEIAGLLRRMGLQPEEVDKSTLEVTIPPYRADILHEVDLVEDVVMAYGLNRIEPELPRAVTTGSRLPSSRLRSRVRDLMVGMGFQEVSTYMLSSREVLEERSLMGRRELVEIVKPVSAEFSVVRDALLPKLLSFLGCNTHFSYPQKVFEYGDVVEVRASGARAEGTAVPRTHVAAAISDYRLSFEEIQAVAAALFRNLSMEAVFIPHPSRTFIEGRTAKITVCGREVGTVGEVSPEVLVNFGIACPVGAMECDLSRLTD